MTRFRDCLLFAVLMSLISTGALAQADTQAGTQSPSGNDIAFLKT
jgi:hypothetical protein